MTDRDTLYYRLDPNDVIVEVGRGWDDVAEAYDARTIVAERIVGTPLFAHVTGEVTRDFVWTMLDTVRKLERPSIKRYRCDGPDCKRHMEMTIAPHGRGGLVVAHRLISVEPLPFRLTFSATGSSAGGARRGLLVRCSACNRIRAEGCWIEPEKAVARNVIDPRATVDVAYGVCPACRTTATRPPSG